MSRKKINLFKITLDRYRMMFYKKMTYIQNICGQKNAIRSNNVQFAIVHRIFCICSLIENRLIGAKLKLSHVNRIQGKRGYHFRMGYPIQEPPVNMYGRRCYLFRLPKPLCVVPSNFLCAEGADNFQTGSDGKRPLENQCTYEA